MSKFEKNGQEMYDLCNELFPLCRSLTGNGVRNTLSILERYMGMDLKRFEVPSGTKAFDWEVPKEWNFDEAYIIAPNGKKILDSKNSNLHVLNYSMPIEKKVSLAELKEHLHTRPDYPDAIPYVTSYYKERWGFCMTYNQYKELQEGEYYVVIKSSLNEGFLTYGEVLIPGEIEQEIFISTYICHPSMANNELSGPAVAASLAKWIVSKKNRRYSYRIIFIPETIGSIVYISRNLHELKKRVIAGFNLTCLGDNNSYSYLPSRKENTITDNVIKHVFKHMNIDYKQYCFLDRGSDERQYCSPGVDLPVALMMRSKFGEFKEYHTSKDNMSFISPQGLEGSFLVHQKAIQVIEANKIYRSKIYCEAMLGKRGLYSSLGSLRTEYSAKKMLDILAYADGLIDLLGIADKIGLSVWELQDDIKTLLHHDLIEEVKPF